MAADCNIELSLYPLRTERMRGVIDGFVERLRAFGLDPEVGCMSTVVHGEVRPVFNAVGQAFAELAENHDVVLVLKASNACPVRKPKDRARGSAQ